MITFEPPPLDKRPLVLGSDDPSRGPAAPPGSAQGPAHPPVPPLAGRVELGGPHAVPVTEEFAAQDPRLALFVRQEAAHSVYHLVLFTLGFPARPATPRLWSACLRMVLDAPGAPAPPVAWSMTPQLVTDERPRTRTLTLGPQLALLGAEASLGEWSSTTTENRRDAFLTAGGGRGPTPRWELRRTRTMPLTGDHDLAMVVRAPRGTPSRITLTVEAATRGNLLRRYSALPDPLTLVSPL